MSRFQTFLVVLAIFIAFIVLISFIFLSFFRPSPTQSPLPSAPSSAQPVQRAVDENNLAEHPKDGRYQTITPEGEQQIDRDTKIFQLIKKLPHRAENFSLIYDIDTNTFTAELSANRRTQANRELDQFLQENGIMDRDWLYNLTIKQQTY